MSDVDGKTYFSPTQDFFSHEKQTQYVKGLVYRIKPGNDFLAGLVRKWLDEGKVTLMLSDPREGKVGGKGTVT